MPGWNFSGKWFGKKIIIVGAARQGTALARFMAEQGAQVILTDQRDLDALQVAQASLAGLPVEWVCGGHPLSLLANADLVCPSGGVPLELPLLQEANRRGIPFSNDSQIFLEEVLCPVIGITGSSGKTTTTTLVGRIAQADGENRALARKVWVGGNIGSPLIAWIGQMSPEDLVVMELSSFQLELITSSPQVAAILNVTPNHLDRHGSMLAYAAAKSNILTSQPEGSSAILGRDDPVAWSLHSQVKGRLISFGIGLPDEGQEGTGLIGDDLVLVTPEGVNPLMPRSMIELRGSHNILNVLAACAISWAVGLPVESMQLGVSGFGGVDHRLQFVRTWGGADWYNDSIATAPERSMAAIRSFDEPLILLAGGRDKDLPWEEFARLVRQRVQHLVVFGEAAAKVMASLAATSPAAGDAFLSVTSCPTLHQAVETAARILHPGYVVLLSPGGTSFDEFIDFEERGECFEKWVMELT